MKNVIFEPPPICSNSLDIGFEIRLPNEKWDFEPGPKRIEPGSKSISLMKNVIFEPPPIFSNPLDIGFEIHLPNEKWDFEPGDPLGT